MTNALHLNDIDDISAFTSLRFVAVRNLEILTQCTSRGWVDERGVQGGVFKSKVRP